MLWRLAWRNLARNRRRTALTAGAGAFAALLVLLSLAMARGSHERWIDQAVRLFPGHIQVSLEGQREHGTLDYTMPLGPQQRSSLEAISEGRWAPRLETWGLASPDEDNALGRAAWILGVDVARERQLTRVLSEVEPATLASNGGSPGVLLGEALARDLEVAAGETIVVLTSDRYGSQAADRFAVAGTFRVGDPRFDERAIFTDIAALQALLDVGDAVTHAAVFEADGRSTEALALDLERAFPAQSHEVVSWPELVPDLVQFMLLDDVGNWLTMSILLIVVGFGLLNTILMSVLERVREFGVLRALGQRPRAIFKLVFAESLMLSLMGVAIGVALAVPLCLYMERNPMRLPGEQVSEAFELYRIDPLIVFDLTWQQVWGTFAVVLLIGVLAAVWPAVRAARGRPVDALRETL